MNNYDISELTEILQKQLKPKRFRHSLGVSFVAASLAMRYKTDINKAQTAGLIHDIAKRNTDDTYIEFCKNNNIEINDAEYNNPGLLHAKIGAFIARDEFGITDEEILSSIICHTTGKPEMTILDKIIYIADYIEPGRKIQPNLEAIRQQAFKDIDNALLMILNDTVDYLKTTGKVIDPNTEETYNYYKELIK